jgi:hypothetical protein
MTKLIRRFIGVAQSRAAITFPMLALGVVLAGCESALEVNLPGRLQEDALSDKAMATTLVNSVIADFECAFGSYVFTTGLYTDEFEASTHFINLNTWDTRRPGIKGTGGDGCPTSKTTANPGTYRPLQTARVLSDKTYELVTSFGDLAGKEAMLGTAAVYGGYASLLIGEGFCGAALDGGPPTTREEMYALAEKQFTTAIKHADAASDAALRNFALLGRARARLDAKKLPDALADAKLIPQGFIKNATFATTANRRLNYVSVQNLEVLHVSVEPDFRDLKVGTVADPRVPSYDLARVGQDGHTRMWGQRKYANGGASIPIAKWQEAQLIIAEISGGQEAVAAINRLRTAANLPLFSSSDPAEIRRTVLEERRRELFIEGHRLNDILRLPEVDFHRGSNHKGEPFGDEECIPIPDRETQNNPNF